MCHSLKRISSVCRLARWYNAYTKRKIIKHFPGRKSVSKYVCTAQHGEACVSRINAPNEITYLNLSVDRPKAQSDRQTRSRYTAIAPENLRPRSGQPNHDVFAVSSDVRVIYGWVSRRSAQNQIKSENTKWRFIIDATTAAIAANPEPTGNLITEKNK